MVIVFMLGTIEDDVTFVEKESFPFAQAASRMVTSVVNVQQWFTDVAASHNPDGFKEAEASAVTFREDLKQFQAMFQEENNAAGLAEMDALGQSFEAFYSQGTHLANVYMKEGVEAGNVVMESFDVTAANLGKLIYQLRDSQTAEAAKKITGIKQLSAQSRLTAILICAVALVLGGGDRVADHPQHHRPSGRAGPVCPGSGQRQFDRQGGHLSEG